MKNVLTDFLRRIQWADTELLEKYFGAERFRSLLRRNVGKIESVVLADGHTCYSCMPANYRQLPGIYRRGMVRKYVADRFGYSIFDSAESPCRNADFRAFDEERKTWIRVWGDMGSVAPESLLIFRNPPDSGKGLLDIILTAGDGERAAFLQTQAEIAWKSVGSGGVEIVEAGSLRTMKIMPGKSAVQAYAPEADNYPGLSSGQLSAGSGTKKRDGSAGNGAEKPEASVCNDTKKRTVSIQEIRNTELCMLSTKLTPKDYALLRFIAGNPFLNAKEIGLLFGGDSSLADCVPYNIREYDRIKETIRRVEELRKLDLLKRITKGSMAGTIILGWKSIDLIAAWHGTIPLYLNKYSQWPEKSFDKDDFDEQRQYLNEEFRFYDSHCHYKQRWGVIRPEHQVLLKEFCAALLVGARSWKAFRKCDVEVTGVTTISSNLKISAVMKGKQIIRQLHPDGCCSISYRDPKFRTKHWKVFFEIERNTNTKNTLLQKMEKYRKFIPAAKLFYRDFDDIALVFFFDDTGDNPGAVLEKTELLLEVMKRNRITGYIGLLSDAKKVSGDWRQKHGEIERNTCGGMVLYQKIWRSSVSKDPHEMHWLLGIQENNSPFENNLKF